MKKYIGIFVLLTIAIFVTRMKNQFDDESLYMIKISGNNEVSTIMLAKSKRNINLEEASNHFIENFITACGSCEVDERGYIDKLPNEYRGVFEKSNASMDYTLITAKGVAFVIVNYEGSDNVSHYNCRKLKSNTPSNIPINVTCVNS